MDASVRRAIVVGSLLLAIGTLLPACKREPLPESFGIYFQSPQGLWEIPVKGDPGYAVASDKFNAALATKNPDEIKLAMKGFEDSCQKATEQPVFILYHDTLKPQMLHLQHGRMHEDVELGITPVADKQFMYRLSPKQHLSPGIYVLVGSAGLASERLSCFMVGTHDEIYKPVPAKTQQ